MTLIELTDTLIKYALCRSKDERLITHNVCEQFPDCNGCPYQTGNRQANDALTLAYSMYTPYELKESDEE